MTEKTNKKRVVKEKKINPETFCKNIDSIYDPKPIKLNFIEKKDKPQPKEEPIETEVKTNTIKTESYNIPAIIITLLFIFIGIFLVWSVLDGKFQSECPVCPSLSCPEVDLSKVNASCVCQSPVVNVPTQNITIVNNIGNLTVNNITNST